jgi:hypothetical protein
MIAVRWELSQQALMFRWKEAAKLSVAGVTWMPRPLVSAGFFSFRVATTRSMEKVRALFGSTGLADPHSDERNGCLDAPPHLHDQGR